ncbi:hypothetical protein F5890DRAFT_1557654 [Lentinula detonsa]|uniref:Uncharacterized protein n=1 Tax=Lentinula detonsa TaxID=2804962 RepID=A0AA38UNE0_9AGAR|nr:hypothetical protein F5890DRAFT_1557654 [Lentinula detonsa]
MTRDSEVVPADGDVADCNFLNDDPQYGIFNTGPGCPSSKPCQLTSAHWDNDLNPFNEWDSFLARRGSDLVLVGRDATKLQKTGNTLTKTGSALGKAAKGADAVPEIGEIVGTAIQVVATFLKLLGHIFSGIAEAERKSAHARSVLKLLIRQLKLKHPASGWLMVTVHPKHTTFFQGNEHIDWSHSTTSIKTVTGTYKFDVYAARAGIFSNDGDGGYQNYQKNHKKVNEHDHYTIVAVMKDAKGVIVGFEGNGDGSNLPVPVSSQLHDSLTIITGPNDKAPLSLSLSFDKDKWDS